jgi:hypothetical protein
MSRLLEDIKNLPPSEKAEVYFLLQKDKELESYMTSNKKLFEQLTLRDKAFAEGKIHLTTREDLSKRLQRRRSGI